MSRDASTTGTCTLNGLALNGRNFSSLINPGKNEGLLKSLRIGVLTTRFPWRF